MDNVDMLLRDLDYLEMDVVRQFQLRWPNLHLSCVLHAYRGNILRGHYEEEGVPVAHKEEGLIVKAYGRTTGYEDIISGLETQVSFTAKSLNPKELEFALQLVSNCIANNFGDIVKSNTLPTYKRKLIHETEALSEPTEARSGQASEASR